MYFYAHGLTIRNQRKIDRIISVDIMDEFSMKNSLKILYKKELMKIGQIFDEILYDNKSISNI